MDILYQWLNRDVKLSAKIENIQYQFANGYFFGELLYLFHQQLDFMEQFQNSDLKQVMVKNFILIEPTLRSLGVTFNSNDAKDIIEKLKDCLEKLNNPVDIQILQKTGRKNQTLPLKKMNTNHSKKRMVESELFSQRLVKIIESEKSKDMRQHLKCFEEYGAFLKNVQHEKQRKELKVKELLQVQKRLLKINQLKRYLQFKNAWDSKSKKQWVKNLQMRKQNQEILRKIEKNKLTVSLKRTEHCRRTVKDQTFQNIDDFEARLALIKTKKESNPKAEEDSMTAGFFNRLVQMEEYADFNPDMSKIIEECKDREKNLHSEEFKKERDKRIRKMIVDLKKNKLESEFQTAEKKLLEKLTLESNQEEEIRYEIYKTKKLKEIFKKNRQSRDQSYFNRFQKIRAVESNRNQTLFAKLQQTVLITNNLLSNQVHLLDRKFMVDQRDKHYKICRSVVYLLLDYSEQTYHKLQISNNGVETTPIFQSKEQSYFREGQNMLSLNSQDKSADQKVSADMTNLDFKNYLKGKTLVPLSEEFSTQTPANNLLALLTEVTNNVQRAAEPLLQEQGQDQARACFQGKGEGKGFDLNESENPNKNTMKWEPNPKIESKSAGLSGFGDQISPIVSIQNNALTIKKKNAPSSQLNHLLKSIGGTPREASETGEDLLGLSQKSGFEYIPLKICILGINKDMKMTLERLLAQKYNLKVFRTDEQVNHLMIKAHEDQALLGKDEQRILDTLYSGNSLNEKEISVFVKCFLAREFGTRNCQQYLEELLKERDQKINDHKRWKALCKEEKTNFKSIFNEDSYRMTTKNQPNFQELQNLQEKKDNLEQMIQAEDDRVERELCLPEGFILSGLPEQLAVLIELEKQFMQFEFEDRRARLDQDLILSELEVCFGKKLSKEEQRRKRSIFDLVIIVKSKFDQLVQSKLNKFEVPGQGKEVDLAFMQEHDKQNVAEFVSKLRIDDNVYALPSKFHSNLKSVESISRMYTENFKSNGELQEALGSLVVEIDDDQDLAVSVKQVEARVDRLMRAKEAFYQGLLLQTEKREEEQSSTLSKQAKKQGQLGVNSIVEECKLKDVVQDLFDQWNTPLSPSALPENLSSLRALKTLPLSIQNMVLMKFLAIFESYKSNLLVEFKNLNEQDRHILDYCGGFLNNVNSFILIDDDRAGIVHRFQQDYNLFLTNWPDLIFKENAKSEYHKRIFDMRCKIHVLIQAKSDGVQAMQKAFDTSDFFEQELKIFLNILVTFLTQEIHRHILESQIINNIKRFVEISSQDRPGESFEEAAYQMMNQSNQNPFSEEVFVKIEQVATLESYLELVDELREVVNEMKLDPGSPPDLHKKKTVSKTAKKKKLDTSEEQETADSPFFRDLEETLLNESRVRTEFLFGEFKRKGREMLRLKTHQIQVVAKVRAGFVQAEKGTINMLSNFLGLFVEKEKKIEREIQMKSNIFYVDGSQLNFLAHEKVDPFPLEPNESTFFTISCINKLRQSLSLLSNEEEQLESLRLIDLFSDIHMADKLFVILPSTWVSNKVEYYQKLFAKLQESKNGMVKFNVIFLFILLEGKPLPSDSEVQYIKEEVEKRPVLSWEDFQEFKWYFFSNFSLKENFYFDYRQHFIRVLFEVFSTETGDDFDFIKFYEHFVILLRSLKNTNNKALYGYTFFKLSQEL